MTSLLEICNVLSHQSVRSRGLVAVARCGVVGFLAPSPIEPEVRIVLRLSDCRVAVTKQQLKARIAKLVISADVHQSCWPRLGCQRTFRPVIKDFGSERPFFADIALHQPARERIGTIAGYAEYCHSAA